MVPRDEILATHSTVIWILPIMPIHVSFHVVLGHETLSTQVTVKWIIPSKKLLQLDFLLVDPMSQDFIHTLHFLSES